MKDIYYIAAKSLMRWPPDVREKILDKLGPFERECVSGLCARINEEEEHFKRGLRELSDYMAKVIQTKGALV